MKKSLIILPLLLMSLAGCSQKNVVEIQILSFNDFHGAINESENQKGLLNFASTIKEQISKNKKHTVLLSAGDMYQGSAQSNINRGKLMIDVMNELGLEAMTIGNHEFDWGIDTIKAHHDGIEENGEANFDYLGCNIYSETFDENLGIAVANRVDWAKDYKIVERDGIKIGIVGWISSSCKDDISTPIIKNHIFQTPTSSVINIAKKLRSEEKCDLVIAMGHDDNNYVNSDIGLDETSKVNLIINGHTHKAYINNNGDYNIIQSSSYGEYLGITKIKYDKVNKIVKSLTSENKLIENVKNPDNTIKKIIDDSLKEINPLIEEKIGVSGENIDRTLGARWTANAIKSATNADIGVVNWGGIRSGAFPIKANDDIKVSKLWELMPFENMVELTTLTGSQVKSLEFNDDSFVFSSGLNFNNIEDDAKYRVAACDFIFDKKQYCFMSGEDVTSTNLYVRDALIEDVKAWTKEGLKVTPSKGTKVGVLI
ncbi:MAG: 5'-nucleotidase C-terminal domain-containing protein [Erysipelotrichales bacterium]|nr:5'-nucleotidase C-terminal domain-containing protein [Erysipelotrichales bacterium]